MRSASSNRCPNRVDPQLGYTGSRQLQVGFFLIKAAVRAVDFSALRSVPGALLWFAAMIAMKKNRPGLVLGGGGRTEGSGRGGRGKGGRRAAHALRQPGLVQTTGFVGWRVGRSLPARREAMMCWFINALLELLGERIRGLHGWQSYWLRLARPDAGMDRLRREGWFCAAAGVSWEHGVAKRVAEANGSSIDLLSVTARPANAVSPADDGTVIVMPILLVSIAHADGALASCCKLGGRASPANCSAPDFLQVKTRVEAHETQPIAHPYYPKSALPRAHVGRFRSAQDIYAARLDGCLGLVPVCRRLLAARMVRSGPGLAWVWLD